MLINCPHCSTALDIAPEHFGQNLQCPACKGKLKVDAPEPTSKEAQQEDGAPQREGWPEADQQYLVEDEVEIVVQVMGKVRGRIKVPADADNKAVEETALADDKVASAIEGKTVRKVIVVPGKVVNRRTNWLSW